LEVEKTDCIFDRMYLRSVYEANIKYSLRNRFCFLLG